jgi:hypothetical protein
MGVFAAMSRVATGFAARAVDNEHSRGTASELKDVECKDSERRFSGSIGGVYEANHA